MFFNALWFQNGTLKLPPSRFCGRTKRAQVHGAQGRQHSHVVWVPGGIWDCLWETRALLAVWKEKLDGVVCLGRVISEIRATTEVHQQELCPMVLAQIVYSGRAANGHLWSFNHVENEQQTIDRAGGRHGNKGDRSGLKRSWPWPDWQKKLKQQKQSIGYWSRNNIPPIGFITVQNIISLSN